jgi:hypothetical protein
MSEISLEGSSINTSTTNCETKKEDGTCCVLDAVHNDFGGEHMGRTEDGTTIFWKTKDEQI